MKTRPFEIPKDLVRAAWKRVRANKGAAGIDAQTIKDFEQDLAKNLYKIWNRMSSGSYMAPAVLAVEITKSDGGMRRLGVPTVADRVAQTVVKMVIEPELESVFDDSSYGYRPGRHAHQAVGEAMRQCSQCAWVVDLDIEKFFDNLDHELLLKAVWRHTDCAWARLYIRRWLKAPMQMPDGRVVERERGTPQGGVISPLLANLYLHYAFDSWVRRTHPGIKFERYADDIVCHCRSEAQATAFLCELKTRLGECKLALHPDKTQIVYCQDSHRSQSSTNKRFTFLGFDFQPRVGRRRAGDYYVKFCPAVGRKALARMGEVLRRAAVHRRTGSSLSELLKEFGPKLRGWMQYYGAFYRSRLSQFIYRWQRRLVAWALDKFKRFRKRIHHAERWWKRLIRRHPRLELLWNPLKVVTRGRLTRAV